MAVAADFHRASPALCPSRTFRAGGNSRRMYFFLYCKRCAAPCQANEGRGGKRTADGRQRRAQRRARRPRNSRGRRATKLIKYIRAGSQRAPFRRGAYLPTRRRCSPTSGKNTCVSTAEWAEMYSFSAPCSFAHAAAAAKSLRPTPRRRHSRETCSSERSRYSRFFPMGCLQTAAKPTVLPSKNAACTKPPLLAVSCNAFTTRRVPLPTSRP